MIPFSGRAQIVWWVELNTTFLDIKKTNKQTKKNIKCILEKKRMCTKLYSTVEVDTRKYLLLPYPSLAHSGADRDELDPSGDERVVSPSNSCALKEITHSFIDFYTEHFNLEKVSLISKFHS